MANFIGRLGVVLGLDSAEFSRGIDSAGKRLDAFASAAVSAGKTAGLALIAAGAAAAKYADEIADVAKANEVTIDSIVKLRNALSQSGGAAENAGKLLSSFTANIDKAAEGGDEVQKTFKTLGLSLNDLRKMDIDTMFAKSVESLAAMTDPITRNAKAMELFGKASKGVDFIQLNEEIKANAGVTDEQSKGIEAAAKAYDLLVKNASKLAVVLTAELGPSLNKTLEYITNLNKDTGLSAFGTAFKVVALTVVGSVTALEIAFDTLNKINQQARALLKGDAAAIIRLDTQTSDRTDQKLEKLKQYYRDMFGDAGAGRGFMRGDEGMPAPKASGDLRKVELGKAAAAKALADAKKQLELELKGFTEAEREREANRIAFSERASFLEKGDAAAVIRQQLESQSLDRERERLILQHTGRNMRSEDLQYAQAALEIEYKRKDAIQAINTNDALTQEAKQEALTRNNALAAQALELETKRLQLAKQMREGTLADGFRNAAEATMRNAKTEFERGQQVFESVMGNMETAIGNFVATGKLSFKSFARSIIADLIAIQMKAQAVSILKMAFSAFSPSSATVPMQPVGGYAEGGDPPVGVASMVGERGPELFVPKTAGTIIPNHQLAGMMGGGQTVNYNGPFIQNMSAIDTQTGVAFLVQNKQAIWAANQSAQRSLPMSK